MIICILWSLNGQLLTQHNLQNLFSGVQRHTFELQPIHVVLFFYWITHTFNFPGGFLVH